MLKTLQYFTNFLKINQMQCVSFDFYGSHFNEKKFLHVDLTIQHQNAEPIILKEYLKKGLFVNFHRLQKQI